MTDVKIVEDRANPLLRRRELRCEIAYDGPTPSRAEVKAAIVKALGSNPETTVVMEIRQNFGARVSDAIVHIYDSKEAMDIVPSYIINRETKKEKQEEKKEAPKQQEAAKEQ